MRAAGKDKVLGAARLVAVAGDFDGAVIGSRFAVDEALRIEGASAAGAIGHALGDAASVGVHEPGEVEHFAEGQGAEVEIEAGDENVVARIEQVAREYEEVADELAFVDSDALDLLADLSL